MTWSVIDSLKKTLLVRPHPAGLPFIAGGAIVTVFLLLLSKALAFIAFIFTAFCLYFFRDPVRVTPQKPSLVIAPADGIVSAIDKGVSLPAEIADGDAKYTRVSIFLSVLDVHVNRVPVSGTVVRKVYKPGKFFNADLDKASEHNERCGAVIRMADGTAIGVVQIAGLIARRIVNGLAVEQNVIAGARFGIIRFGSRTDVYIPDGKPVLVCRGQRATGGETVLADLAGHEPDRAGIVV